MPERWSLIGPADLGARPAGQAAGRPFVGVLLVLLSTAAVAASPTAAKLALDAGSNTATVVASRGAIGVALMGLLLAGSGQAFAIGRPALERCFCAGLFYAVVSYGFIGSVASIPVSLAVVVFFTHPILVAASSHWRGEERLTRRKLALALAALAGIAMVLGLEPGSLDPVGIGLAALAAAAACGMILFTARAQEHATSTQANFHMTAVAVAVLAAATTAGDAWVFPSGVVGWLGLAGSGLGVAVGLLLFFAAFRHIGPVRATVLSNVEPLLSVLFAAAVLGERLGPWQWAGVALVVAALVLFEAPGRDGRPADAA
jgi:drug/metabolite transporter (DMT)-like permease